MLTKSMVDPDGVVLTPCVGAAGAAPVPVGVAAVDETPPAAVCAVVAAAVVAAAVVGFVVG